MADQESNVQRDDFQQREEFQQRFIRFMFGDRAVSQPGEEIEHSRKDKDKDRDRDRNKDKDKDKDRNFTKEFFEELDELIESATKLRAMARRFFR